MIWTKSGGVVVSRVDQINPTCSLSRDDSAHGYARGGIIAQIMVYGLRLGKTFANMRYQLVIGVHPSPCPASPWWYH